MLKNTAVERSACARRSINLSSRALVPRARKKAKGKTVVTQNFLTILQCSFTEKVKCFLNAVTYLLVWYLDF